MSHFSMKFNIALALLLTVVIFYVLGTNILAIPLGMPVFKSVIFAIGFFAYFPVSWWVIRQSDLTNTPWQIMLWGYISLMATCTATGVEIWFLPRENMATAGLTTAIVVLLMVVTYLMSLLIIAPMAKHRV